MRTRLTVGFVVVFYLILAGIGWGIGSFLGLDVLRWHNDNLTSVYFDAAVGVAAGLAVVVMSQGFDRYADWARELGRAFGEIIGKLELGEVFIFAVASSIGEEIFFRGFLQQLFSSIVFAGPWGDWIGLAAASLIFGLLHIGPDVEKFWPWTVFAVVMGVGFGWMYLYTGNILGPVLAHFTVNFFNLQFISQKYGVPVNEDGPN